MPSTFPLIETDRLRLRSIDQSDAEQIYQTFSKEEVTRYYGMSAFKTKEEAEALIHSFKLGYQSNRLIRWGIELKDSGTLIGTCGYHSLSPKYRRAEIGYEISRDYWRMGYSIEAIKAILSFGFEKMGLIRVGAVVMIENRPSRSVLQKLGFKEEGRLRDYIIQDEKPYDVIMHSILKEEWQKSGFQ